MKCGCGSKLNSHNKDGLCNVCITENKLVPIRFVETGTIHDCWNDAEYQECLESCKEDNMSYKVYEYKARAKRMVNIQRLVRAYKKGEDIDIDVLMSNMIDLFLIDVSGIIKEK